MLTTTHPGLEEEFKDGRYRVVFRTREELRERAESCLPLPRERQDIAKAGQERALASHGYHDRMQRFLHVLG